MILAFAFNLYEGEDCFDIQLVGCDAFDEEDDGWAASETFSTGEDLFCIPRALIGDDWKSALIAARQLVTLYLTQGAKAATLKSVKALAIGFVDGDIDIIWRA